MSIDVQHCTWAIENPDPDGPSERPCHRKTTLVFSKGLRMYPRCGRHAGPKVLETAREQGFDIHYLEPHPELT